MVRDEIIGIIPSCAAAAIAHQSARPLRRRPRPRRDPDHLSRRIPRRNPNLSHSRRGRPLWPKRDPICSPSALHHGLGKALPKDSGLLVPFNCDVIAGEPISWAGSIELFITLLQTHMSELAAQIYVPAWELTD